MAVILTALIMEFSISDKISFQQRILILLGLLPVGLIVLWFIEPVPQDPDYHLFSDTRGILGIPNFNNVISNVGFALVGLLGTAAVLGVNRYRIFVKSSDARPYIVFFSAIALISLGSAYYHWEPTTQRLLWDRLPMSIAFMALFSAVISDRINANVGNGWLLWVLIGLGILSLVYWNHTELLLRGDLRYYAYVQFFPVIVLPFTLWLFPDYHYIPGSYIGWIVAWYGLSKILEHFDAEVFAVSGYLISGHTLKHLAAAISAFVVLRVLTLQLFPDEDSPNVPGCRRD
jgi:hypothetical protein